MAYKIDAKGKQLTSNIWSEIVSSKSKSPGRLDLLIMLKLSRLVENSSIELFCDFEMQAGTIQAFRCLFLKQEFLTDYNRWNICCTQIQNLLKISYMQLIRLTGSASINIPVHSNSCSNKKVFELLSQSKMPYSIKNPLKRSSKIFFTILNKLIDNVELFIEFVIIVL